MAISTPEETERAEWATMTEATVLLHNAGLPHPRSWVERMVREGRVSRQHSGVVHMFVYHVPQLLEAARLDAQGRDATLPNDADVLYTVAQVAHLAGVSRPLIWSLIKRGDITACNLTGRHNGGLRIAETEVARWLGSHGTGKAFDYDKTLAVIAQDAGADSETVARHLDVMLASPLLAPYLNTHTLAAMIAGRIERERHEAKQ